MKKEIVVGSIVEGVITGITNFGAFVDLPDGTTGLVHISEVADEYVKDINDFYKKNDKVEVKVLSVEKNGKVGLSIKQAQKKAPPAENIKKSKAEPVKKGSKGSKGSFEDKMSRFFKESDERLLDLKRNTESKRGSRGSSCREG